MLGVAAMQQAHCYGFFWVCTGNELHDFSTTPAVLANTQYMCIRQTSTPDISEAVPGQPGAVTGQFRT